MRNSLSSALATFALLNAAASLASGRIEINQASIDAAGGFPYTITEPGAYVLTGNLDNPDKDTNALVINAERVHLDLNGFRIKGPNACQPECSHPGSGNHIAVLGRGATIRDGTLRGAGNHGIGVSINATGLRVELVRLIDNGGQGVYAAETPEVVIHRSMALRNGSDGFFVGTGARIEEVVSAENGAAGAAMYADGLITHSYVAGNGQSGLKSFGAGALLENISLDNAFYGAELYGNGGYGGNLFDGNGLGTVLIEAPPDNAHEIYPNACNGSTTCP